MLINFFFRPVTYQFPPVLVNITNEGELIFHFEPRDQNIIPKKIFTMVNITLSRFGSSVYRFNIDPGANSDNYLCR